MNDMSAETKKYLLIGLLICVVVFLAYKFGKTKFDEEIAATEVQITSQNGFTPVAPDGTPSKYGSDIDALNGILSQVTSEYADISSRINSVKDEKSGVISQQDMLIFLGYETNNDLTLTRFKEISFNKDADIYRGVYEIELNGFYPALMRFTQDIDALGVFYNIKKMSVRVNNYKEMTGDRAYDNTSLLDWYNDSSKASLDLDAQLESDRIAAEAEAQKAAQEASQAAAEQAAAQNQINQQLETPQVPVETPTEVIDLANGIWPEDRLLTKSEFYEMDLNYRLKYIYYLNEKHGKTYEDLPDEIYVPQVTPAPVVTPAPTPSPVVVPSTVGVGEKDENKTPEEIEAEKAELEAKLALSDSITEKMSLYVVIEFIMTGDPNEEHEFSFNRTFAE